jgi:hypothetical protein
LRHDYDGGNARTIDPNFGANAHVGLLQTVIGAFPCAVKKKNGGPFLFGGPVVGDENLILENFALHVDGAVEKTGFVTPGAGRSGQMQAGEYQDDPFYKLKEQKNPPCASWLFESLFLRGVISILTLLTSFAAVEDVQPSERVSIYV